jgi:hypothetical protein
MPGEGPQRSRSQSVPRPTRSDPLSPREQLEQSANSRRVWDWDPRAQPSEPILFPKLRIHFADFPCLHCSIDQRLFTLET